MEEIKKISVKEMLTAFYNEHLKAYSNQLIELNYLQGRDPNEVVITLIQQSGQGLPPMERKIKAKEAQMRAKENLSKEESILKVIEELIKKEDNKPTTFL